MNEVRIRSWEELNREIFSGSWQRRLARFRSSFAFRGARDVRAGLASGLQHLGGHSPRIESRLLANFRKYAHRAAAAGDSVWNWLALAQHHGLPTRVVDWTYSPYVAAHFATQDLDAFGDVDGVVGCVDFVRASRTVPASLRRILLREDAQVFTAELLADAAASLRDFDRLAREPFVVFFEPPSLDERIVNQFALFSVMSDARADLRAWLDRRSDLCRRVIIPADVKWELRDKLDQANINERVLFPGLDGLAAWLTRYYAERAPGARSMDEATARSAPRRRAMAGERRQRRVARRPRGRHNARTRRAAN